VLLRVEKTRRRGGPGCLDDRRFVTDQQGIVPPASTFFAAAVDELTRNYLGALPRTAAGISSSTLLHFPDMISRIH
jgi:hypothetical protein